VRAGAPGDGVDLRFVAAGEDDVMAAFACVFDERGADALAAAGDEETACLHPPIIDL
jgi:hypothetical protein